MRRRMTVKLPWGLRRRWLWPAYAGAAIVAALMWSNGAENGWMLFVGLVTALLAFDIWVSARIYCCDSRLSRRGSCGLPWCWQRSLPASRCSPGFVASRTGKAVPDVERRALSTSYHRRTRSTLLPGGDAQDFFRRGDPLPDQTQPILSQRQHAAFERQGSKMTSASLRLDF